MVDYPEEFPTEAVGTVLQIISSADWGSKKDEFAHAVWNLQGFLQRMILPLSADDGGSSVLSAAALASTLDDAEAIEALQHIQSNPLVMTASTDVDAIKSYSLALPLPAIVLLKWLLSKLIEEIVK